MMTLELQNYVYSITNPDPDEPVLQLHWLVLPRTWEWLGLKKPVVLISSRRQAMSSQQMK